MRVGRERVKRILLIVDDIPEVARALRRFMTKSFDLVLVAHSAEEAESMLCDPDNPPTHLVCDHYLGKGMRVGADLIPQWRRTHAQLVAAVLLTGSEVENLTAIEGIDRIYGKPLDPRELACFLLAAGDAAAAR
jgi:DNA-binding response OmpR family regulator